MKKYLHKILDKNYIKFNKYRLINYIYDEAFHG